MADLIMALPSMIGDIASIINWCKEYFKNVRDAARAMNDMIALLGSWKPQLELLEDLIRPDDQSAQALRMKLANEGFLEHSKSCLRELKELMIPESAVSSPSKRRQLYDRLTWPIMKQDKAKEILRELESSMNPINLILNTNNAWNMKQLREEVKQVGTHMSEQDKREVLRWLQPDKIDSHDIHLEKKGMLEDETCDWMVQSEIWKTWMEGGTTSENGYRRLLWIHGIPGSGKTILASFMIDTIALAYGRQGCSYYYCSHQHGQDETRSFLQWVVRDLCTQSRNFIPPELYHAYEHYRSNIHSVPTDGLLKCLLAITKQFRHQVCIVVDAIDESSKPRNHFLKVLTTIGTDPAFQHVSLIMTSRDEPDIRTAFKALPPLENISSFLGTGIILTPQLSPFRPRAPYPSLYESPSPTPHTSSQPGGLSLGTIPDLGPPSHPREPTTRPYKLSRPHWPAQFSGGSSSIAHQPKSPNSPSATLQPGSPFTTPTRQSTVRKFSSLESEDEALQIPRRTPQQVNRPITPTPTHLSRGEKLVPEISNPNQGYTELSMDNQFVLKAISTYVSRKLQRIDQLRYLSPEFLMSIEDKLAREARGMFRWVACQIDMIIQLDLSDEPSIKKLLGDLPPTVFDTYERLIVECIPYAEGYNENNRTFARTALALICSNSAMIPSADVLVEASLFNVPRGLAHNFDVHRLEKILGCLIKVTRLNRKPTSVFRRDDDAAARFRVAPAHYTVKEYLFSKNIHKGPARDFALSNSSTQVLELQVVFNGLLSFGANRPRGQRDPTPYEEYCLRMTDKALRVRRSLIAKEKTIWDPVLLCLRPEALHHGALRNQEIRLEFPRWTKLNAVFRVDKGAVLPGRQETGILVSLLVLKWPELAGIYLRQLAPEDRAAIWTDRFTPVIAETGAGRGGGGRGNNQAAARAVGTTTILQLCVTLRRLEFLEQLIEAGADFAHENEIIYAALRDPYAPAGDTTSSSQEDGVTTGQLLKMVLQRGADPNPKGFLYTPLQAAACYLEERWIQSLLIEHADPNAVGDPEGAHPYNGNEKDWFQHHPLRICREADPDWQEDDEFEKEEQINRARLRVENLLVQYGAREPDEEEEDNTDDGEGGGNASQPEVIVVDS